MGIPTWRNMNYKATVCNYITTCPALLSIDTCTLSGLAIKPATNTNTRHSSNVGAEWYWLLIKNRKDCKRFLGWNWLLLIEVRNLWQKRFIYLAAMATHQETQNTSWLSVSFLIFSHLGLFTLLNQKKSVILYTGYLYICIICSNSCHLVTIFWNWTSHIQYIISNYMYLLKYHYFRLIFKYSNNCLDL